MSVLDPAGVAGAVWLASAWSAAAALTLLAADGFRRWFAKCSREVLAVSARLGLGGPIVIVRWGHGHADLTGWGVLVLAAILGAIEAGRRNR